MSDDLRLHFERRLSVPSASVWRALTETSEWAKWWGPRGFTNLVEADVRVGGDYRITMKPPDGDAFHLRGEFREVVPNERLAYTFVWEEPDPDDIPAEVTVDLIDHDGATTMTVEHGPFKNAARMSPPRGGWTEGLEKLQAVLEDQ